MPFISNGRLEFGSFKYFLGKLRGERWGGDLLNPVSQVFLLNRCSTDRRAGM